MDDKPTDRRIQRTRALLLEALRFLIMDKGYDNITVQDLIDRANVGRSTFYAHFQDKETLMLSGLESLWGQWEQVLHSPSRQTDDSWWSLSLSLFEHAESQRPLFKALAGEQAGSTALKHIQKRLYRMVYDHLRTEFDSQPSGIPVEIIAHHLVSSFVGLLTWWVDSDTRYNAVQMNNFYRQIVQSGLGAILR
jgi:AcrR family transcriptional regulator